MGFAVSWCAVPDDCADDFLDKLGLVPTGESEEFPESPISTGQLTTGWRVLWYNEYGCPFLQPKNLADLSSSHDVLLCLVEEHAMASSSELWSGGKLKWRLSHQGENGPKGLSVAGEVPEALGPIRQEMEALQLAAGGDDADVDYLFEIPLKVAQALVGFKHDEDPVHLVGRRFNAMVRGAPPKRKFLARLLKQ